MASMQSDEKKLVEYEKLMTELENNPYFLYNYAVELYYADLHNESLEIAKKCRMYWADYDLEMLVGENYKKISEYNDALMHFEKASLMVPVKFMPLYRMFQIYKEQKESHKLEEMANRIVNKPIKINSPWIEQIKREAERTLTQTGEL
jgi:tetratricopeptide (TPR) repeat protein